MHFLQTKIYYVHFRAAGELKKKRKKTAAAYFDEFIVSRRLRTKNKVWPLVIKTKYVYRMKTTGSIF